MKTDALLSNTFCNSVACNNSYLLWSSFDISADETCGKNLSAVMLEVIEHS